MQPAPQLAIATKLHVYQLLQREPHQIKRLRDLTVNETSIIYASSSPSPTYRSTARIKVRHGSCMCTEKFDIAKELIEYNKA